jgi:hypothetical protein
MVSNKIILRDVSEFKILQIDGGAENNFCSTFSNSQVVNFFSEPPFSGDESRRSFYILSAIQTSLLLFVSL